MQSGLPVSLTQPNAPKILLEDHKNKDFIDFHIGTITSLRPLVDACTDGESAENFHAVTFKKLILKDITDSERTILNHIFACAMLYGDVNTVKFFMQQNYPTQYKTEANGLSEDNQQSQTFFQLLHDLYAIHPHLISAETRGRYQARFIMRKRYGHCSNKEKVAFMMEQQHPELATELHKPVPEHEFGFNRSNQGPGRSCPGFWLNRSNINDVYDLLKNNFKNFADPTDNLQNLKKLCKESEAIDSLKKQLSLGNIVKVYQILNKIMQAKGDSTLQVSQPELLEVLYYGNKDLKLLNSMLDELKFSTPEVLNKRYKHPCLSSREQTPLEFAVYENLGNAVQFLIEKGAAIPLSVEQRYFDNYVPTALGMAIKYFKRDILNDLLKVIKSKSSRDEYRVVLVDCLKYAIREKKLEIVQQLVNENPEMDIINGANQDLQPMVLAIVNYFDEAINFLHQKGAHLLNAKTCEPLYKLLESRHVSEELVLEILLNLQKTNLDFTQLFFGQNSLLFAMMRKPINYHEQPTLELGESRLALMNCLLGRGNAEQKKHDKEKFKKWITHFDAEGQTIVHQAAQKFDFGLLQFLLDRCQELGISDIRNKYNATPIQLMHQIILDRNTKATPLDGDEKVVQDKITSYHNHRLQALVLLLQNGMLAPCSYAELLNQIINFMEFVINLRMNIARGQNMDPRVVFDTAIFQNLLKIITNNISRNSELKETSSAHYLEGHDLASSYAQFIDRLACLNHFNCVEILIHSPLAMYLMKAQFEYNQNCYQLVLQRMPVIELPTVLGMVIFDYCHTSVASLNRGNKGQLKLEVPNHITMQLQKFGLMPSPKQNEKLDEDPKHVNRP